MRKSICWTVRLPILVACLPSTTRIINSEYLFEKHARRTQLEYNSHYLKQVGKIWTSLWCLTSSCIFSFCISTLYKLIIKVWSRYIRGLICKASLSAICWWAAHAGLLSAWSKSTNPYLYRAGLGKLIDWWLPTIKYRF